MHIAGACAPRPPAGRILNISVTAHDTQEPSRLLNYLTGVAAQRGCADALMRPGCASLLAA